jgi:SecD/SecF fusion protein
MQLRGLVRFVTIALIVLCIYQLSFTWVARRVESNVEAKALKQLGLSSSSNLTPEQTAKYKTVRNHLLDSMNTEVAYNLGFSKFTYQECKEQELAMGLDLQGGMSVVLQVSEEDVVNAMSGYSQDPAFRKSMAEASAAQVNSQDNFVTLFYKAYQKNAPQGRLASIFSTPDLHEKINFNASNSEVIDVVQKEVTEAVKRTHKIISSRIDKFGVTQPNISLEERTGRIIVELPGVDNPDRVRRYLQATAKLEFWETFETAEIWSKIEEANKAISANIAKGGAATTDTAKAKLDTAKNSAANLLGAGSTETKPAVAAATAKKDTSDKDAKLRSENALFMLMSPPVAQNEKGQQQLRPGCVIGYVRGRDTAKLNEYLAIPELKSILPNNLKILYAAKPFDAKSNVYEVYAIKKRMNDDSAPLDGSAVADAKQDVAQGGGNEISMQMNPEGAASWQRLTAANVKRCVAIVLDDQVYSAPVVQGEIAGGRSSITGNFTAKEAQDLANILQTGKLPAPAKIIQEDIVGASLGQDSVTAGFRSFMIALLVIVLIMYFYYSTGGLIANIALILNLFFTIGILIGFGFSLTMSAIAGLVVTIGMAVDTNIIIFERIKDEINRGKGKDKTVEDGYKHSYAPIIDAHITSLLTGGILFYFGLGPVKGFATTLIVGLVVNLFCGILVTRLLTDWASKRNWNINYLTGMSRNLFKSFNFKFVENRKIAFVISGLLTIAGIVSIFTRGFDKGIDFLGGRTYTIQFESAAKTDEVRNALKVTFGEFPNVKTVGTDNQLRITTSYKINESGDQVDGQVEAKLYEGLKSFFPNSDFETFKSKNLLSSQKVGPTIADDIKKNSVWATIFSLIVIFIYIVIRFRRWQYGLGTIIALFHDVMVVLGLFSIFHGILPFSLEIDQTFIAAILTIIGYSMNDTVIVFDRIREYVAEQKGRDLKLIINDAINHTMSRTIMTSLTVFLVVLILFLFGGEVTRGFAFAMLIGVITGTYSSIFIAMPVLYDLRNKSEDQIAEAVKK